MMGRQVLAVVSIPSPCPGTMMGGLGVCLYRCLWLLCNSCTAILLHEQRISSPVLPMPGQPHSRIIARRVHLCALMKKYDTSGAGCSWACIASLQHGACCRCCKWYDVCGHHSDVRCVRAGIRIRRMIPMHERCMCVFFCVRGTQHLVTYTH